MSQFSEWSGSSAAFLMINLCRYGSVGSTDIHRWVMGFTELFEKRTSSCWFHPIQSASSLFFTDQLQQPQWSNTRKSKFSIGFTIQRPQMVCSRSSHQTAIICIFSVFQNIARLLFYTVILLSIIYFFCLILLNNTERFKAAAIWFSPWVRFSLINWCINVRK